MHNRRKISAIILVQLIIFTIITGCSKPQIAEDNKVIDNNDSIEIGMCFDSYVIERWERDRDVFVSTARELGAVVNVQNANGNSEEQIKQIEYFIEKGVDAIVIVCVDSEKLSDVVKKAKNKGIKVISYDRMILNAGTDLYISFDNKQVGSMMAQALVNANLPNKKIVMIQGPVTDNNVSMIEEGFLEIINNSNIEIVDTTNIDGWRAELAADYLYEHPEILDEIDGIMCGNDNVATSVVRVLSEKRRAGEIAVVGQDAELEACQRIVEGTQIMTVYKPVEKEAQKAAEATVALIKGEELNDAILVNDGTYDVLSIILDPISVNKSNIDNVIIESGFHLKEDVYLNVQK